jgi:ribonuclease Z
MEGSGNSGSKRITRRDMLKASGLAVAGLAAASSAGEALAAPPEIPYEATAVALEKPPAKGTMRITFCGTWYTPRPNQACNSIFVELGNGAKDGDWGDSFVFDCGSGIVANYVALGVPFSRMTKVFLTHLHGDHMSDLTTIYCFGPSSDRKSALHVYGPSQGYLLDSEPYVPDQPGTTEHEGTEYFCKVLLELCKWHRNSFSFLPTGYQGDGDGYDLVPHELDYMADPGLAYDGAGADGKPVKIKHFPAIHAREGAISYRLEWNGMSMVFSGDTKPNTFMTTNAKGVDVLIHEMAAPASVWVNRQTGMTPADGQPYETALKLNQEVIDNSHTPQTAFGYIMSQARPKLAVATHFSNDPDLVRPALKDIRCHYQGPVIVADDLLVLTACKNEHGETTLRRSVAHVPKYPWWHVLPFTGTFATSKFDGPYAQFSQTTMAHVIDESKYSDCETHK